MKRQSIFKAYVHHLNEEVEVVASCGREAEAKLAAQYPQQRGFFLTFVRDL